MTEFYLKEMSSKLLEDDGFDVKITGNIIIPIIGNAIDIFSSEVKVGISNCAFYMGDFSFFSDPLTWLAIKILKKKYMKSYNIKEIKEDDSMTCIYIHNQTTEQSKVDDPNCKAGLAPSGAGDASTDNGFSDCKGERRMICNVCNSETEPIFRRVIIDSTIEEFLEDRTVSKIEYVVFGQLCLKCGRIFYMPQSLSQSMKVEDDG